MKTTNTSRPWSLPTAFTIMVLVLIILVIPTMIVVPFGSKGQEAATVTKTMDTTVETASSPFAVEVMRSSTDTVENIPLEDYVAGVVAAEMPAEFELEALKAQALAARTYTVNHLLHGDEAVEYDVTDTVTHQVYLSEEDLIKQWGSEYPEKMNKIKKAVNATKGQILTYEESPITAAFFSTSNGYTENSEDYWENELPYLRSVESPWDEDSPKFLSQDTFTVEQIETALEIDLPNDKPSYIEEARTDSGRVKEIGIEGNNFSGREIREKLELKSSDFTIKQNNGHFVITTEGYGHGVGMSQYGAHYMAQSGKTYEDIINHYYQGVQISSVDETAPTLVSK
ncbi:stage II sporulation protein D [Oceanobacillus halophilus]|uniref:Stage II sporulation protein D n=2 Tax=Oceanobacillus halophilus TaxID=930130 RepID=A0A495A562_9BACI|nr:stage II sporulation protein D [Oceanobacillus halophilus]